MAIAGVICWVNVRGARLSQELGVGTPLPPCQHRHHFTFLRAYPVVGRQVERFKCGRNFGFIATSQRPLEGYHISKREFFVHGDINVRVYSSQ